LKLLTKRTHFMLIKSKKISTLLLTACVSAIAFAGPEGDDYVNYSPHNSVRMGYYFFPVFEEVDTAKSSVNYSSSFNMVDKSKGKASKGLLGKDITVSGVTRFLTIQRTMLESYSDMTTSDKHISFSDYPNADANSGANAGYPLLELNLKSKATKDLTFNVGYSMGHNMTGSIRGASRNMGAVQNLNFSAVMKKGFWKTSVAAGEVLATKLSRMTLGQAEFTDNYFDRLPWDWYRKSYTRYQEYFALSSNVGANNLGAAPLQGAIGVVEYIPYQTSLKVLYGQTNRSLIAGVHGKGFPSIVQGYRLEKYVFERAARGKAGLNVYAKRGKADFDMDEVDNNTMATFDFDLKVKRVKVEGEIGGSKIKTTDSGEDAMGSYEGNGFGGFLKASFDQRAVLYPFSVQFYHIDKNFGSPNSSILNQNPFLKQGGSRNEFLYNDSYFANIANEAGQLTNNRQGVNLDFEYNFGDLKVQLGYSVSQEIEKITDTLTIQHRVNSFSRSRFRPWFQAAGNYTRIKSFWFRTFETVTLDGEDDGTWLDRDLLGFNALELMLKYRKKIGKNQELILLNLSTANTIKEGFNAFSIPGDENNLVTVLYNDITAAYKINNKLSFVGNFAVEKTTGSERTAVDHKDPNDPMVIKNDFIDQIGHMYAIGVDYDISKKTSVHLRTKYMDHKDKNFTLDKFSGFETTFELKIFL